MRRVASRVNKEIDQAATVARIAEAEARLWLAVLRPALVRWFDVALVVDAGPSMAVWKPTVAGLQHLLQRQGAFRDVRIWTLDTHTADSVRLYAGAGGTATPSRPANPAELVDPSGRRLVLVVSDCVSRAWRSPGISKFLTGLGAHHHVAIVQPLPQRLWRRSALRNAVPVWLRSALPGAPNARLHTTPCDPWAFETAPGGLGVPVIALEPEAFATWAQFVVGAGEARTFGILLPPQGLPPVRRGTGRPLGPEERLRVAGGYLSPTAQRLVGYLAAVPDITLPVIRLIQRKMLLDTHPEHLAEVLLSGLLKQRTPYGESGPDEIQYDFMEGVGPLLLHSLLVPDAVQVLREVSEYRRERKEQSFDLSAYMVGAGDPDATATDAGSRAFAVIAASVLPRLGGSYIERGNELRRRLAEPPEPDETDVLPENSEILPWDWAAGVVVTPGAAPILRRDLRADQPQLVVIPVNAAGTIRLNNALRARLRLAPAISRPSRGFTFAPGLNGATYAYLVTLAEREEAGKTIASNLGLLASDQTWSFARIWLPLMGREGGGLGREESLDIILRAIGETGIRGRTGAHFVIATAPDIDMTDLIELRTKVERAARRPLCDVRQALSNLGIAAPTDETEALLRRAAELMLQQRPGLDNGRIKTRVALLALLEAGGRQASPRSARALFVAWNGFAPGSFAQVMTNALGSLPSPGPEETGPIIFSRDFAEPLRLAAKRADGAPVGLFHIADALLEQAAAREEWQARISARRVLDDWNIDPVELRASIGASDRATAGQPHGRRRRPRPSGC
jgi:hypothetical protein